MHKLADISMFENLQHQAHAGFVSDASVFNREYSDYSGVETTPEWDELSDEYMPRKGKGRNDFEKILVAVNRIGHRYNNAGDMLNSVEDYEQSDDSQLYEDADEWLKDKYNDKYGGLSDVPSDDDDDYEDEYDEDDDPIPNGLDGLDPTERDEWINQYLEEGDNYTNYDNEEMARSLDWCAKMLVEVNPEYDSYIQALRDAATGAEYESAYKRLLAFAERDVRDRLHWQFRDIPKKEVSGWFR